jgi:hypothetical protein
VRDLRLSRGKALILSPPENTKNAKSREKFDRMNRINRMIAAKGRQGAKTLD